MRLFIGYSYGARDRWVEDLVFPLATAFGCDVVHGRAVYGGGLPEEILKLVRGADAMLGFTTRREEQSPGAFSTHPWVIQELTIAHSQDPPIPFVEVREEGVVSPGGVVEAVNAQRIHYDESRRAECLVEIASALNRLNKLTRTTTIRLGPPAVVEDLGDVVDDPTLVCRVQTLQGSAAPSPWRQTQVFPISGGLFVRLRGLAVGELIRIEVAASGHKWRSSYESVDTVDIQLRAQE